MKIKHLNDNLLCAVDGRITGRRPFYHDLVEIAVIPLDSTFSPDRKRLPFHSIIRPSRVENITFKIDKTQTPRIMSRKTFAANMHVAMDQWTIAQAFEDWYDHLGLKDSKRIQVVCHNWGELQPFLMDWLGFADPPSSLTDPKEIDHAERISNPHYYRFFDPFHVRDLATLSLYWDDVSYMLDEWYPFTRHALRFQALKLGVTWPKPDPDDSLSFAFTVAEVYKRFIDIRLPSGHTLPIKPPAAIDYDNQNEEMSDE